MASVKLGPNSANTCGELPNVGSVAPNFVMTNNDMADVSLYDFKGKNIILNIFPSVDTGVCASSVREFNKRASALPNTVVLCIAKDLPFAMKRFCGAEGINQVITLSDFRSRGFGKAYGVELSDSAFVGLFARAIVMVDEHGKISYTQLAPQIGEAINYDAAIHALIKTT